MHGLETLKKLNDAASDNRARRAVRRIARPSAERTRSTCCKAKRFVVGRTPLTYECAECGQPS